MASLVDLPGEILVEIALSFARPQDVKHFSSVCRSFRRTLGQSNQLLWWHVWRKMYWMPDGPASDFSKTIDYWQRVTDVLIPDQKEPKTCFRCFAQSAFIRISPISYGDKFYRALCEECLNDEFWILDVLPLCYLDLTIPTAMHATVTNPIYSTLRYMGRIKEPKNPYKWVHRNDARSFAESTLPPEETSDYKVFMGRWIYNWNDLLCSAIMRIRKQTAEGTSKEHLYKPDFHLGVGEIIYAMINDMVKIYTEEYKQLHVVRSPPEFRKTLIDETLTEVSLGGAYEDKLDRDISDYTVENDPRPPTNNMSVNMTHFSAKAHQARVAGHRPPFDLSAICRGILVQHFGVPCDSEYKLSPRISLNPHNHVLREWFHTLFSHRYRRNVDLHKLHPLQNDYHFKCPFCGIFTGLDEQTNTLYHYQKGERFVEHIFEKHYEKFGDSWNSEVDGAPPDAYEFRDGGEYVKVDYFASAWIETPPTDNLQDEPASPEVV
ncbi:hypothetical protein TWF281_008932 [Arthrobotrys megalospora]